MKVSTLLTAGAALTAGYVLGAAAGHGRYRQITTVLGRVVGHPKVQQVLFDLAGQASSTAEHLPGPAADLVDHAATHVQDSLTQPEPDAEE